MNILERYSACRAWLTIYNRAPLWPRLYKASIPTLNKMWDRFTPAQRVFCLERQEW